MLRGILAGACHERKEYTVKLVEDKLQGCVCRLNRARRPGRPRPGGRAQLARFCVGRNCRALPG